MIIINKNSRTYPPPQVLPQEYTLNFDATNHNNNIGQPLDPEYDLVYRFDHLYSQVDENRNEIKKVVTITEQQYNEYIANEIKIKVLESTINELTEKLKGINIFNNI